MKIIVVDHDPAWANEFLQIKNVLLKHISSQIKSIEHVGSTSVPDLAAKPILDIDIIIPEDPSIETQIIQELAALGYEHQGDLGISGREAFKRKDERVPYTENNKTWMQHNLYLCQAGSIALQNHLLFRDFLRKNPATSTEYGALKKQLAYEFPDNIDAYIDGKTDFITGVLKKAGLDIAKVKQISSENKIKSKARKIN